MIFITTSYFGEFPTKTAKRNKWNSKNTMFQPILHGCTKSVAFQVNVTFLTNNICGWTLLCSLDNGITGLACYTALVIFVSRHFNVSLLSPCFAPAVLYKPIILPFLSSISNDKDTVIQLLTAALRFNVHT